MSNRTSIHQTPEGGQVSTVCPAPDDAQRDTIQSDDHDSFGFLHVTTFKIQCLPGHRSPTGVLQRLRGNCEAESFFAVLLTVPKLLPQIGD